MNYADYFIIMADLPQYLSLEEKRAFFSNGNKESFIINNKQALDKWFKDVQEEEQQLTNIDATAWIYRGMSEAKHKLLTSSQRMWITTEMSQWSNKSYIEFISSLVEEANRNPIINKVFDLYSYSRIEREFPILSLLQHYGAPTPLMDWTYNNNVAFFFATEGLIKWQSPTDLIDQYFSIYRINKNEYKNELLNVIDYFSEEQYPAIESFRDLDDDIKNGANNFIFYVSDFERKGESKSTTKPFGRLRIRTRKPMTTTYNQNIIPQEGLFIFNPFKSRTLEEIFNTKLDKEGWNLMLTPFDCYNVRKDLSEYLRRKIHVKYSINNGFVYPHMIEEARLIKESTLNNIFDI